jgi:small subunit ribosomal protein S8
MMTDPIADMLTRIRNGSMARHERVEMPHSKLKEHVADVLKLEGYVDDVRVSEGEEPKTLVVVLRYGRVGHRRDPARVDARPPRLRAPRPNLARRLGYGDFDPQHEPRRDDRP